MTEAERIRQYFDAAVALPADERDAYLRENCDDEGLREKVLSLLRHYAQNDDFLSQPAVERFANVAKAVGSEVGEFRILEEIGRGGMGIVYLAKDTVLDRRVALKILAHHLVASDRAIGRFRQEAKAAARLSHPGIVPIYRYDEADGVHFIAMEFVEGVTLSEKLNRLRNPRLEGDSAADTSTAVGTAVCKADQSGNERVLATMPVGREYLHDCGRLVAAVADALEYAHRNGVIHRDVKPSNILVDPSGRPRLTDFGIAKLPAEEPLTVTGDVAGTYLYMSPEQAAATHTTVDHRSDIFSLGVVLYEALTLTRPFGGSTPQQIVHSLQTVEPRKVRSLNPSIDLDLETICHKALEKRPVDRYQTAAHFAADLQCYSRGDPILAKPPSRLSKIKRLIRKRRGYLLTASIVLAFSAILGVGWHGTIQNRASLSEISVFATTPRCSLFVGEFNTDTRKLGELNEHGLLPADLLLHQGLYRLVVHGPSEGIAETTVLVTKPGHNQRVEFGMLVTRDELSNMKRFPSMRPNPEEDAQRATDLSTSNSMAGFYIDLAEVSNSEYRDFADSEGREWPPHWREFGYREELADRPIVAIPWESANAYCRSKGKRLPTEAEWEYAMRWPDARLLPWKGDVASALSQPTIESIWRIQSGLLKLKYEEYVAHVRPVRSDEAIRSEAGLYHGATNVSEYTESVIIGPTIQVIVKGGSWLDSTNVVNLASSSTHPIESIDDAGNSMPLGSIKTGFRCACSILP